MRYPLHRSMWSLYGGGLTESWGPLSASSQAGPQITCGANAKGSWVQISTGLAYPTSGILLVTEQWSAAALWSIDIGLGPAGSEQVVIPDVFGHGTLQQAQFFPVALPAGVEISIRAQATTAVTFRAGIYAIPTQPGLDACRRWASLGTSLSGVTQAVAVDSGATANTVSAWAQISAGVPFNLKVLHLMLAGQNLSGNTSSFGLVDIGRGASGNEQVILSGLQFRLDVGRTVGWCLGPLPVDIPAGARLAIRHQSNSNVAASSRSMYWALLGGG